MAQNVDERLAKAKEIVRSLAWENLTDLLISASLIRLPFLNAPILKQLFSKCVWIISNKLWAKIVLHIDLEFIAFKNSSAEIASKRASVILAIMLQKYGEQSPQFKEAKQNAKTALADFMRPSIS